MKIAKHSFFVIAVVLISLMAGADVARSGGDQQFKIVPLNVNMRFGETKTLVKNGSISVVAECSQQVGSDRIRLLAATTVDGAFMNGQDSHNGPLVPSGTLDVATPADNRELFSKDNGFLGSGSVFVENNIDEGFVQSATGRRYIGVEGETLALGLNAGADCTLRGVAFVITRE